MNRSEVFHGSLVQQMMSSGNPNWWSMNNMRQTTPEQTFPLLPTSPQMLSQYPQPSTSVVPVNSWHENQEPSESWSQLLLGGIVGDEEKYGSTSSGAPNFQAKKMFEIWEDQVMYSSQIAHDHVKQEYSSATGFVPSFTRESDEKIQQASNKNHPWNHQVMPDISSPRSCLTTSLRSNMLDFSNNKEKGQLHLQDNSSECNSTATGSANKKARVQGSSSTQHTTFKVRKEKLGDRITALHQLVSPFGKTDTASVLLEAIGYIRFLQNQIEALSLPYLANGSGNKWRSAQGDQKACLFPEDPGQLLNENGIKKRGREEQRESSNDEPKKDLKSRGLCLVPVSFTMHVGSDNGADFWAPAFGSSFH